MPTPEPSTITKDLPRRIRVELLSPAERVISAAIREVEALVADVRLTDAVLLLDTAKRLVADVHDHAPVIRAIPVLMSEEEAAVGSFVPESAFNLGVAALRKAATAHFTAFADLLTKHGQPTHASIAAATAADISAMPIPPYTPENS